MSHYGLRNKTELASFLGVSPQTVSNWYSRNSIDYDLVFEKCAGLDFNWLVTGNASVYGHRIGNVSVASDVEGAYDVPVASMLPVGMTGGSCPVGDGAGLRSGGMPAVLSSDGECIACVADGAMPTNSVAAMCWSVNVSLISVRWIPTVLHRMFLPFEAADSWCGG